MESRVCPKCKIEKQIIEFSIDRTKKSGLQSSCKKCTQIYYANTLDYQLKRKKTYRENNKDKTREALKKWKTKTRENNPLFNFIENTRQLINNSLRFKSDRTNTKIYQILGCTSNQFRAYLESQFEPWMNWDNRALYNGQPNYGWDIDHIIPLSSVKTEEEAIKLNHHTNLRPRCSYLNRVEDNRKHKLI